MLDEFTDILQEYKYYECPKRAIYENRNQNSFKDIFVKGTLMSAIFGGMLSIIYEANTRTGSKKK